MRKKIPSFEMKFCRKVMGITWMQRKTNDALLNKLDIAENWLINNIIRRKVTFFGHIKRQQGLTSTIMEGMILGRRA